MQTLDALVTVTKDDEGYVTTMRGSPVEVAWALVGVFAGFDVAFADRMSRIDAASWAGETLSDKEVEAAIIFLDAARALGDVAERVYAFSHGLQARLGLCMDIRVDDLSGSEVADPESD